MMNAKISTGLLDEQDASPAFFQPLENVNAPPRPGFQGSENVDAVPSPRFQTLEETGAKSSKGWKMMRLGEITQIRTGKLDANAQRPGGPYPFFTCGEETLEIDHFAFDTEAILLAGNGNFNVKWYRGKFNAYQRTYVIEPDGVHGKWLFYAVQAALRTITKGNRGSVIRFLRIGDIVDSTVCVPPLAEQKQIVAEIEKQFTRLEAGVSALKRVQANLKRYRAAVLKAACSGELVPAEAALARARGQKSEDGSQLGFETGAELLERILAERRKNWSGRGKYKEPAAPDTTNLPPLPEGWTWANVGQLGEIKGGKRLPMGHHYSPAPTAFPYIRVADFDNYGVRQDDLKFLHEETQKEIHRYTISKNDIYISIAGSIGVVGVVPNNLDGANLTENAAKITSLTFVEQKYICFWLSSNTGRSFIADKTIATTQPKLALFRIEVIPTPLPPFAEQTRIVAEVERRLSVVEELEAVVSANLQRATRLRQSILQKAFSGELV